MQNITFTPLSRNRYRCRIGSRSFIVKKAAIKSFRGNATESSLVGYLNARKTTQRPAGKKRHASKFRSKRV